jgi:hypothetical protein
MQEPEEADDPESYTPFQFMLQFMLQPLLVASGSQPAGHMAPALIKMCRTLKRTADTGVSRAGFTIRLCIQPAGLSGSHTWLGVFLSEESCLLYEACTQNSLLGLQPVQTFEN